MRSLLPLSLLLIVLDAADALKFEVRTSLTPPAHRVGKRAVPIQNNANAAYLANVTIAGTNVSVILDTGSSDLWVAFPGTVPSTTDTGKGLSLGYAVGSASGNVHTGTVQMDGFTVENQAFLQVANASSFSSDNSFDGLIGLGPNEGSAIYGKLDDAGQTLLNHIFQQDKTTSNYITFLLNRKNDPGQSLTGEFTIGTPVAGFENITSQTKLNVETVHRLLEDQQHWQAITDKNGVIGPDGNVLNIDSIVPKAPDGQLVAVFDSGFTFSQVPRDMADAIYGRVQGAVYDATNEWWTVPCGQLLNLTFFFGGVAFPIHPLDTVDDNFKITDKSGNHVCIGAFQPITSAFSLFGNFDMIMGMTFLRNAYTLMDFGDWVEGTSNDQGDPYIQLLPLTNAASAHNDFVQVRLGGTDTSGSSQYALLPSSQQQHSPVSEEEKKKKYEEMILSRWPYIFVGCLIAVILLIGFIVWKCCCKRRRAARAARAAAAKNKFFEQKSETYLPLQVHGQGIPGSPQPGTAPLPGGGGYSQHEYPEYSQQQYPQQQYPQQYPQQGYNVGYTSGGQGQGYGQGYGQSHGFQ